MANILLTQKCNQKCPYCFASYNEGNDYISKENFVKAIKFLKKTPGEKIGLLGGEPLLHPEFAELCNILNEDRDIRDVVVVGEKHEILGEIPVAKIVTDNEKLKSHDIIAYCDKFLDKHKIPKKVIFCDKLEKTYTGKIIRKQESNKKA